MNDIELKSNIKSNNYSNISDAIYDYINLISSDFESDNCIKINSNEYRTYMKYNELSQTIIFRKAKEKIHVSNSDIKECIAKIIRNNEQKKLIWLHLVLFQYLDKIIENGILIAKADETKGRYKYSDWNYYVTPIKLNNENYIVEFDTTLRNDGQRHFRLERIFSLEELMKKQVVLDRGF